MHQKEGHILRFVYVLKYVTKKAKKIRLKYKYLLLGNDCIIATFSKYFDRNSLQIWKWKE